MSSQARKLQEMFKQLQQENEELKRMLGMRGGGAGGSGAGRSGMGALAPRSAGSGRQPSPFNGATTQMVSASMFRRLLQLPRSYWGFIAPAAACRRVFTDIPKDAGSLTVMGSTGVLMLLQVTTVHQTKAMFDLSSPASASGLHCKLLQSYVVSTGGAHGPHAVAQVFPATCCKQTVLG